MLVLLYPSILISVCSTTTSVMGSHPRPHFFISRPDHTITPLLALDEFPSYVRITGVRPVMTQADTQAMMSLGVKERSAGRYEVHLAPSSANTAYQEHASTSDASGSPHPLQQFAGAQEPESAGELKQGSAGLHAIETAKRAKGLSGEETMRHSANASQDNLDQEEPVDVEDWRRDIRTGLVEEADATQVDIGLIRP